MHASPDTMARRLTRFCGAAALGLLLIILVPLAVSSLGLTVFESVYGRYEESITFLRDALLPNVGLTLLVLAALLACRALLERFARVRLDVILCLLWLAVALFWVLGIGLQQEVDCKDVVEAAKLFARGNYRPMRDPYFSAYPYQLPVCLFMEAVMRLIPGVDINLFMQVLNVLLSTCTLGMLCALAGMLFERGRRATQVMLLAFLPFLLFNTYVYGTVPMIFLVVLALLCWVRYLRTRKARFALAYALAMGAAYAAKQNALIPILAVLVCSALDGVQTRDVRPLGAAVLALVIGVGLSEFSVWQYELRSGVQLGADVSALARLVMGLQESQTCAGWFNGYTAQFIDNTMSAEAQQAIASADLRARLAQLAADPGYTLAFLRDKYLSQWLEPSYSTLWYGFRCDWLGRFNGLAILLYRENSPVRALVEGYMNLYQQAFYALAVVGAAACLKRRGEVAVLVLPVTVIGGFLFHMLFEAKSQYIFVYIVYLMPLAGYGLAIVGDGLRALVRRALGRAAKARG